MPSKKAYSSLCSTFFTSLFFAQLEGRNLSNRSITGVSEKKRKICNNLTDPMKKKYCRKNVTMLLFTLYHL